MHRSRNRAATALTAAIALAVPLGALGVVSTGMPGGQGGGGARLNPAAVAAGQVVLTTTSTQGQVAGLGKSQVFTGGQQCLITPLDSVHLLEISGSIGGTQSGSAGFRDGDIGVFEPGAASTDPNNASQCFRVDFGSFTDEESLTLELGDDPGLTDSFGPLLAASATADIYAKTQTGTVEVSTLDSQGNVITTSSYTWPKTTKVGNKISIPVITAGTAAPAFDGIRLTAAAAGSFSLRGATFNLVSQADAVINCTDKNTYTDQSSGVSVTYSGNADGSPCQGFGITLDTDASDVTTFHKPLAVDPDAQFVFVMPWDEKPAISANELPTAQIDFEIPGREQPVWHDVDFCPDYLYVGGTIKGLVPPKNADGTPNTSDPTYQAHYLDLKGRDMEEPAPGAAEIPENAGIQFGCIGARTPTFTKATSGFNVQVTDTLYVIGDVRMGLGG